jgi:hypothetical protein
MKFRILHGKHTQKEDRGAKDADNNPVKSVVIYKRDEIVESTTDLAATFNRPPNSIKFERLTEDGAKAVKGGMILRNAQAIMPAAAIQQAVQQKTAAATREQVTTESLKNASVKDLQALAAEEEVDLKGSNDKAEILRLLKAAGAVA